MIPVKSNNRNGKTELLKPRSWTLLESIYGLLETTDFCSPMSNIASGLLHINFNLKIPYKKAFLTSGWNNSHDRLTTMENRILIEFILVTGENVSK